jgi:hypothetical protein
LAVITSEDVIEDKKTTRFTATDEMKEGLLNGILFLKALKNSVGKYADLFKGKLLPTYESFRPGNAQTARFFNWSLLTDPLKKLELTFDNDVKSLIIAGDHEIVFDMLKQLKAVHAKAEVVALQKLKMESSTYTGRSRHFMPP